MKEIRSIQAYLTKLEQVLSSLPKKDRDAQLQEVEDHLLELKSNTKQSETDILKQFLSPEAFGDEILNEYSELYGNHPKHRTNITSNPPTNNIRKWIVRLVLAFVIINLILIFLYSNLEVVP